MDKADYFCISLHSSIGAIARFCFLSRDISLFETERRTKSLSPQLVRLIFFTSQVSIRLVSRDEKQTPSN